MKFSEHLSSHLTPEWRTQYINYEIIKEYLYKCVNDRSRSFVSPEELATYFIDCDADFFPMCLQELNKINNFFSEKLAEAKRKFDTLKQELEAYRVHAVAKQQTNLFRKFSRDGRLTGSVNFTNYPVEAMSRRRISVVKNLKEHRSQNLQFRKKVKTLHDLKLAFSEFYLSLILLQNYQSLNFTGFRKILKKHDKLFSSKTGLAWRSTNVDKSEFHVNDEVDVLIEQIETVYTKELESGDRQKAMKRLRVPPLAEQHSSWSTFRLGFFLGVFCIQATAILITILVNYESFPAVCGPALRIFRSTFLLLLFLFLIGVNIYYWRTSGVNHVLIFEIDPRHHLTPTQLMEESLRLMVLWACCVLYFIFAPLLKCPAYLGPFVLVISLFVYIINPVPIFNFKSRMWLLSIMQKIVFAPFYSVKFADFWVADQLNSLSFLFVDFGYFICFFGCNIQWNNGFKISADLLNFRNDQILECGHLPQTNMTGVSNSSKNICSTLWLDDNPVLRALPAWFRFAQCLRRYYDNWPKTHKLFPHVINAGKYLASLVVVIASVFYVSYDQNKLSLSALLIACIINSVYTCSWDILVDWGLFDRNAQEDKILRDELVYQYRFYYYLAIIENLIGRLMWVIPIVLPKCPTKNRDLVISIIMTVEALRRFIWNFFRLENEHLNNVGEFRAVRDIFIAPIKLSFDKNTSLIKLVSMSAKNITGILAMEQKFKDKESEEDLDEKTDHSVSGPTSIYVPRN